MSLQRPVSVASTIIPDGKWDHLSDARREPPKTECIYRVGPAPREDVINAAENSADIGTLDSDLENEAPSKYQKGAKRKAAGSRALIIYFAKMATKTNKEHVDYRFLESLFQSGAKINVTDKHGQTALHEISRNWHIDVAKFFICHGADVNKADNFGRSPLHLAAAVNNYQMVDFLISSGANVHAKTLNENQSPIHYAAKYNAVGSLKVLIEHKARINDRDFKQRTPVFLAAEMAREESARYLVDIGVPVGVFDDTGMSAIALMVEKMPHIAVDALDQFQVTDTAFRKDYFYLNYLEYNPSKWREENVMTDEFGATLTVDKKAKKKRKREKRNACPTTALKLAVQLQEFEVIMHPVIQQLIKVKWNLFGMWGAIIGAAIHFTYILIWTCLAIVLPKDGEYYGPGNWWRIPLEILGILMTMIFVLRQIYENKIRFRSNQTFRLWRTRQLNRDMDYCHPRWPQEKTFLFSEMKAVRSRGGGLLSDPWNIMDFMTYAFVLVVIVTRIIVITVDDEEKKKTADRAHLKIYAAALIFMWLHFMKSCRPFTTLGPFITMLGHVIMDTVTFAFLFFEFFIPYTVGFWILFGGSLNAEIIDKDNNNSVDWEKFHNLVFSVWSVVLNVDFNYDALVSIDKLMAQIMVGSFLALSTVLCLNLYIALLSETFNRVYSNATANASLLQANTILQIEQILSKKRKKMTLDNIQDECGPLVTTQALDEAGVTDEELWDKTVRNILGRLEQFNDFLKQKFNLNPASKTSVAVDVTESQKKLKEVQETYALYQGLKQRAIELYQLQGDIYDMKCAILTYMGEGKSLPPRPKFVPIPVLDIKPPSKELIDAANPKLQERKLNRDKNNEIFRTIMDKKSDGLDELGDEDEPYDADAPQEMERYGSWEDVSYVLDNESHHNLLSDDFE